MNSNWISISTECLFIKELLDSGVTDIRNASYANRGQYFKAFSNLSIGLERVGKICIIIDYAFDNRGEFPSQQYIKNEINHSLKKLYEKSTQIINKRSFQFNYLKNLDQKIHQNALEILHNFALSDRYHNIDSILDKTNKSNPINVWRLNIDNLIWNQIISDKKKIRILNNAHFLNQTIGDITSIFYIADDDKEINTVFMESVENGFVNAVSPYRQLILLQIIRYWHELLCNLEYYNKNNLKLKLPYFSEYLREYLNSDKYFLGRKKWN